MTDLEATLPRPTRRPAPGSPKPRSDRPHQTRLTSSLDRPTLLALAAIGAVAIALRVVDLGHSFWGDEDVTIHLLREPLWQMLRHDIPGSERTPPLYYLIAWVWSRGFGYGELAERSLTALIGLATVAVAYPIGVELRSRRAGLILAALIAVSPIAIWFSQDARAYGLAILLTSVGLLLFVRALRTESSQDSWRWALASALALTSHYFAVFLIVPQAAMLLASRRTRSRALWPAASVAVVWVLLVPLLAFQATRTYHTDWISFLGVLGRLRQTLQFFETGSWYISVALLLSLTAAAAAIVAVAFQRGRIGRRELLVLGVGVAGLGLPVLASLVGLDYVEYQNLSVAWVPFVVVLAMALASLERVGTVLAVVACGFALFAAIKVQSSPALQQPDWRTAARALQAEPPHTLFVLYPTSDYGALRRYDDNVFAVRAGGRFDRAPVHVHVPAVAQVRRIVVLAEDVWVPSAARTLVLHAPPGFHEIARAYFSTFAMVTYAAAAGGRVSLDRLAATRPPGLDLATTPWRSAVLEQRAPAN